MEVAFQLSSARLRRRWGSAFLRFREFRGQIHWSDDQRGNVPHIDFHKNRNLAERGLWRREASGRQALIQTWNENEDPCCFPFAIRVEEQGHAAATDLLQVVFYFCDKRLQLGLVL